MKKNKIKILIVEDSPAWIKFHINLLNQLFEKNYIEINFEMSARAGFNKVMTSAKSCYDLIISDLEMEEIEGETYAGIWFIKNIIKKTECKNSKIIIISGSYYIDKAAKELNVDFIPKHELASNPLVLRYKLEETKNILASRLI